MTALTPFRHFDELQPFNDRQHLLECIAATEEAPDVMTFVFKSDRDGWFRYLPGQFVTLELPVTPDEPVMRTYTLSSTPSRPFSVSVTVKAQASSVGTRWMLEQLRPGMRLKAFGPLGDFSFVRHPGERYLFISAGSGITPMMSMTRWFADCAPQTDVAFLSCARRPGDLLFRSELETLAAQMPNLALGFVVEAHRPKDGWHGLRGRIDGAEIGIRHLGRVAVQRRVGVGEDQAEDRARRVGLAHPVGELAEIDAEGQAGQDDGREVGPARACLQGGEIQAGGAE